MSKSLLNFRVQISKALVNSKNPIFNSKIFLLHFRPSYPYRPTRPSAQPSPLGPLLPQAEAKFAGPSRWRICKNTFSSLIHAFRSRRLLSIHPLTHGPHFSVSSSPLCRPTPAVSPLCRCSSCRPLHISDATDRLPPPPITPPLIPFEPSLNEP
jgi:hypothetical protein